MANNLLLNKQTDRTSQSNSNIINADLTDALSPPSTASKNHAGISDVLEPATTLVEIDTFSDVYTNSAS